MTINILQRFLSKLAFILPGGFSIRPWLHKLRGVRIGENVWISQYVYIDELHPEAIIIDDNCTVGLRTTIFSHLYWGKRMSTSMSGQVHIEKNVYIGPHCVILPNVQIGEGSVIKAGTVVSKNVPAFTLYGAVPAIPLGRVTVPLTQENSYEEFVRGLRPIHRSMRKND